jgi:hypothetical protein
MLNISKDEVCYFYIPSESAVFPNSSVAFKSALLFNRNLNILM